MGTNYYWYADPPCPTCHRDFERIHIGKSSAGWCFGLHVMPEDGIHDLADWEKKWETGEIRSEYGDRMTPEDMRIVIMVRHWDNPKVLPKDATWFNENHAVPGPYGLARSRIHIDHCIGHGDGTWDLIIGEFS